MKLRVQLVQRNLNINILIFQKALKLISSTLQLFVIQRHAHSYQLFYLPLLPVTCKSSSRQFLRHMLHTHKNATDSRTAQTMTKHFLSYMKKSSCGLKKTPQKSTHNYGNWLVEPQIACSSCGSLNFLMTNTSFL